MRKIKQLTKVETEAVSGGSLSKASLKDPWKNFTFRRFQPNEIIDDGVF
ncbi:hypothetical protein SLH49_21775 [Cognatiyoonia sp. IB215446]|nr:hypothetical protein [Cognatiyoonia sp. IB215446]MDX8350628.1 hypothetical protein [Cognatiyoonia sp. IB215446]